jgi:V8-like Glu-specific endopeptidase
VARFLARGFLFILLVLVCLARPGLGAANVRASIVVIGLYDAQERKWRGVGTAFHLGKGFFYTNAHVILGGQRLQRQDPALKQWLLVTADEYGSPRVPLGTAEVRCVDKRYQPDPFGDVRPYDAATVQLTDAQTALPAPLAVSRRAPAVGERVSVLGYPNVSVLFEMRGKVVEVVPERFVMDRDPGTAALPGSSGSPVFNADAEVIGIMQAGNVGRLTAQAVTIHTALAGCPIAE